MGEIAAKLTDAASMFWQSLDPQERRVVLYLLAYFTCSVMFALHKANDERRRQRIVAELREEIARGAA